MCAIVGVLSPKADRFLPAFFEGLDSSFLGGECVPRKHAEA